MISSPDINKLLTKRLSPILRENGFSKVSARRSWGWSDKCVLVLQVRAVGSYFSSVTGWPPMSVGVWTGVYYDFIPFNGNKPPNLDDKGRLIPNEAYCHMQSHLSCSLDQSRFTHKLSNPAERAGQTSGGLNQMAQIWSRPLRTLQCVLSIRVSPGSDDTAIWSWPLQMLNWSGIAM